MKDAYKDAGVDVRAGYESVALIKKHIKRTETEGVLGGIGNFSGLFKLDLKKYPDPVLVSGTDGVGTKLKIAQSMGIHDTIGIDAVAMCVNDVLCQGADPLFFLDYIACGKNYPAVIEQIVKGVAEGCIQSGCALVGGETAEMPGFYKTDEYDIAGFCVGAVNRNDIVDGREIIEGDVLLGLPSTGVHSNGFSLIRKIFGDDAKSLSVKYKGFDKTIGEVLITPTKIYVNDIQKIRKLTGIKGLCHITGGGFVENIPRMFIGAEGLTPVINKGTWKVAPIFDLLSEKGEITEDNMYRTFNMGIGMMIAVRKEDVAKIKKEYDGTIYEVGYVAKTVKIQKDIEENILIRG
ncbi:MAG: phosphoribosylformylglycinamidine cyclo-ligase [Clostridia bacterium]|jgi:phosphoribosylformylglycinamidine cyclo-ligase